MRRDAEPLTAGELARPIDAVVLEDMPVAVAMAVMSDAAANELPVLSKTGAVVGMLRSIDLVTWTATRMGYVGLPTNSV